MTEDRTLSEAESAYKNFLSTLNIHVLRSLGREIGVYQSTKKKKEELIEEIFDVDFGKIPAVPQSKRGAPVKDKYIDPKIWDTLRRLKYAYLSASGEETVIEPTLVLEKQGAELEVNSSEGVGRQVDRSTLRKIRGRIQSVQGISMLVSDEDEERAVMPEKFIKEHSLHFGDTVVSHVEERHNAFVAIDVLSVNDLVACKKGGVRFEDMEATYPWFAFDFSASAKEFAVLKYLDWLVPVGKGQRCLVAGRADSGKSLLLKGIMESLMINNPETSVFVLMCEQAPEAIAEIKKIVPADQLIASSYEEDPEEQIREFDQLLDQIKELVVDGEDVCLLIDSLTAFARVYNESDRSVGGKTLSCGLESKTLQYIKKYFGSARCMASGGSLTIIASLSTETGDPTDDLLFRELSSVATSLICLDSTAYSREVPLINLIRSKTQRAEKMQKEQTIRSAERIREVLPKIGNRAFCGLLLESEGIDELLNKAEKAAEKK